MLQEFATWWAQQIRTLVLDGLAQTGRVPDALLVALSADGALQLAVRRAGRTAPAGLFPRDAAGLAAARAALAGVRRVGPAVIALPEGSLLQQDAALPLAAERDPATVLRYEMDRLTPFSATDVAWSWQVVRRDPANNRLVVRLAMVPRAEIADLLAVLDRIGVHPTRLEAGNVALDLQAPGRTGRQRSVTRALAIACAVLAAVACAAPVIRQQRDMARVEDAIDALKPRLALVDGLRSRLAAHTSAEQLLQTETARAGNALLALAAVTRALPDDTYLTALAMKDRQVTLTGRSAAAARLIGDLSAAPELRNPTFAAPVMRLGGDKLDQFSIRVELTP